MKKRWGALGAGLVAFARAAGLLTAASVPAAAQDFYAGKTISIVVGAGAGGFELHARALSRHLARFIPGRPSIIVQNMPGGGGLQAVNHMYNVAARDGTVVGNVGPNLVMDEILSAPGVRYKSAEFDWIGRTTSTSVVTFANGSVPVKSMKEAAERELLLATTGVLSSVYLFPKLARDLLGAKFKLVTGYPDTSALFLAIERGEVEGTTLAWDSLKGTRPDWVRRKTINFLLQYALQRNRELPEVPTVLELAKTPADKDVLALFVSSTAIGRAFFAPPGVPAERIAILRTAFDAMTRDKDYIAELATMQLDFDPMPGAELQALVRKQSQHPKEIIERAKTLRTQ